jgi:hypothetical protein
MNTNYINNVISNITKTKQIGYQTNLFIGFFLKLDKKK